MELEIVAYKMPYGIWAFDHEHNNTIAEGLVNGTEKAIDAYYFALNGEQAKAGDQIGIFLTTEKIEDADTVLTFVSTDDYGTVYMDSATNKEIWLCPWLQGYFGEKPKAIYGKVKAVAEKRSMLSTFAKVVGLGIFK